MHMCDLGPDMMIQDSSSKDSNLFSRSLFGTLTSVFVFIIAKKSYEVMNGDLPNSYFVTLNEVLWRSISDHLAFGYGSGGLLFLPERCLSDW